MFSAIMERQNTPAPLLRAVVPAVPELLETLVARCLEREPDERPGAREVATVLAGYADLHGAPGLDELELLGLVRDMDTVATPIRTLRSLPVRKQRS